MPKIQITYEKLLEDVDKLAEIILNHGNSMRIYDNIYGVPRGGVPIAVLLSQKLDRPLLEKFEEVNYHTLVVDDLIDSGKTKTQFPDSDFAVLYRKPHSPLATYSVEEFDGWIEFPFEETDKDEEDNIIRLLELYQKTVNEKSIQEVKDFLKGNKDEQTR